MNEQTRIRLGIITDRYSRRLAPTAELDREWLAEYEALCQSTLRTVMAGIGAELTKGGHVCQIQVGTYRDSPTIDWIIEPRGAPDARRMIRLFPRNDERKGWEILAEVWLSGSPCELTRFKNPVDMTAEVVEQLLTDAIEQIFAAAASASDKHKKDEPNQS